jgi:hypothetical protein
MEEAMATCGAGGPIRRTRNLDLTGARAVKRLAVLVALGSIVVGLGACSKAADPAGPNEVQARIGASIPAAPGNAPGSTRAPGTVPSDTTPGTADTATSSSAGASTSTSTTTSGGGVTPSIPNIPSIPSIPNVPGGPNVPSAAALQQCTQLVTAYSMLVQAGATGSQSDIDKAVQSINAVKPSLPQNVQGDLDVIVNGIKSGSGPTFFTSSDFEKADGEIGDYLGTACTGAAASPGD